MASKRQERGKRSKAKPRTKESVATAKTPIPNLHPALDAPKLDAAAEKRPQAEEALATFEAEQQEALSGGQAGSLQGLSDEPEASAESVDELLEEGNAFEAGIVEGVEDVPEPDQGELKPREVPEDDVPEEYRDIEK